MLFRSVQQCGVAAYPQAEGQLLELVQARGPPRIPGDDEAPAQAFEGLELAPRSGIAVYMSYLIFEMGLNHLAIFIFASLIAVSVSLVLSLKLGDSFSRLMSGVDYKKLSISVIVLQIAILYLFIFYYKAPVIYMTLALITSTAMGMLPHYIGVGKSHLMGVLIIPAIVIYMQMFIG